MNKNQKYLGIILFLSSIIAIILLIVFLWVMPCIEASQKLDTEISSQTKILNEKRQKRARVEATKKEITTSLANAHKRIYAPTDEGLENETLFFTLYNDVIEMLHANRIKIKTISYDANPETDKFVKEGGRDNYFVCDINMEIISNYVNLGKFIQDIYQYPYYVRINEIDVKPYQKDKKILISNMSVRLYAHTRPVQEESFEPDENTLEGASVPIPQ